MVGNQIVALRKKENTPILTGYNSDLDIDDGIVKLDPPKILLNSTRLQTSLQDYKPRVTKIARLEKKIEKNFRG